MREIRELKAAVVGTGFIGLVHVEALRRLGSRSLGVVGSSPERARAKAATFPLPPVYESLEQALADPAVDVVHLTSPNHLHYPQVKQALAAGKHVVCEKPLALDSTQSAELLELAERSGLVHCTNFNIRFYPQCQEARDRVGAASSASSGTSTARYLQDWLLLPTDWNWRLEPDKGGELRAVGDIGSHWLDLAQFVTGRRIEAVFADLATAIRTRQRPTGPVETFARAGEVEREPVELRTDDFAHVLLRFEGGTRGVGRALAGQRRPPQRTSASRSTARTGSVALELGAERGAVARPSRPAERAATGASAARCPPGHRGGLPGHVQGSLRAVYRAVAAGEPGDGYPTFRDGHRRERARRRGAAVASRRSAGWR